MYALNETRIGHKQWTLTTLECGGPDTHHVLKKWPVCPDTEQKLKEEFNWNEYYWMYSSLHGSDSSFTEKEIEEDQFEPL